MESTGIDATVAGLRGIGPLCGIILNALVYVPAAAVRAMSDEELRSLRVNDFGTKSLPTSRQYSTRRDVHLEKGSISIDKRAPETFSFSFTPYPR